MTRETKIGLLVGLAFIIVIGILLSDHLQSAAPQTGAYATETRPNVDSSVTAPRSARPLPPPASELPQNRPVIIGSAPQQSDNRSSVGQQDDNHVSIGPARPDAYVERPQLDLGARNRLNAVPAPDLEVTQNTDRDRVRSIPPVQQERIPAEDRSRSNEAPRNNVLALGNEQDNSRNTRSPEDPVIQTPPAPAAAGGRSLEHVAEPGDTVSKMAQRYLGSRSLANQNLIINANPVLKANPHKIVVGQKYTIPAGNTGRGTSTTGRDNAVGDATPAREAPSTPADEAAAFENLRAILAADHSAGPEIEYTSRPGDTVWGIAVRECNTPSNATVAKILELNKDVLRGDARNLRPNMKLRLPPKTVPAGARTGTATPAR